MSLFGTNHIFKTGLNFFETKTKNLLLFLRNSKLKTKNGSKQGGVVTI